MTGPVIRGRAGRTPLHCPFLRLRPSAFQPHSCRALFLRSGLRLPAAGGTSLPDGQVLAGGGDDPGRRAAFDIDPRHRAGAIRPTPAGPYHRIPRTDPHRGARPCRRAQARAPRLRGTADPFASGGRWHPGGHRGGPGGWPSLQSGRRDASCLPGPRTGLLRTQ